MKPDTTLPTKPCPECKGTGIVPVEDELSLKALEKLRQFEPASAQTIHRLLNTSLPVTAINRRLEDLREIKLVKRRRTGRAFLYSLTRRAKAATKQP